MLWLLAQAIAGPDPAPADPAVPAIPSGLSDMPDPSDPAPLTPFVTGMGPWTFHVSRWTRTSTGWSLDEVDVTLVGREDTPGIVRWASSPIPAPDLDARRSLPTVFALGWSRGLDGSSNLISPQTPPFLLTTAVDGPIERLVPTGPAAPLAPGGIRTESRSAKLRFPVPEFEATWSENYRSATTWTFRGWVRREGIRAAWIDAETRVEGSFVVTSDTGPTEYRDLAAVGSAQILVDPAAGTVLESLSRVTGLPMVPEMVTRVERR